MPLMDCVDCGCQHSDMAESCPQCGRPVQPSNQKTLPANDLKGEILEGKYKVLEKVNQGGMAFLYKGQDLQLDTPVAIKVLFPQLADVSQIKERFRREARLQFKIQHTGIVRVHGLIEDRGIFGMVMDWIDGPDLQGWLKQQQDTPNYQQIWHIIEPVLHAIGTAHKQGIVHRDLKPENILMLQSGEQWTPKITDFGIAKDTAEEALTKTGTVVGTALYMSPEQAAGSKQIDQRSDLYSLGIILFKLLTGTVPFRGDAPTTILLAHIGRPIPSLKSTGFETSDGLEAFIQKALAKQPDERFQNAHDFVHALRPLLLEANTSAPIPLDPLADTAVPTGRQTGMAPPLATQETLFVEHTSTASSRPWTKIGTAVLALAIVVVALFFTLRTQKPTHTPTPQTKTSQAPAPHVPTRLKHTPDASPQAKPPHPRTIANTSCPFSRSLCLIWHKCAQNHTASCQTLFKKYRKNSTELQQTDAFRIHEQQCEKKKGVGCLFTGAHHEFGRGTTRSQQQAMTYYQRACALQTGYACHILGIAHQTGKGRPRSLTKASQYYVKACRLQQGGSCSNLGMFHYKGILRKSRQQATSYFRRACQLRESMACYNLALLYKRRRGAEVEQKQVFQYYRKACQLGHGKSCNSMGYAYEKGRGVSPNARRARQLYQQACQLRDHAGCKNAGLYHLQGRGGQPKDQSKAKGYFRRACRLKNKSSCMILGLLYSQGKGGPRDCKQANRFFQRACRLGNRQACHKRCSTNRDDWLP